MSPGSVAALIVGGLGAGVVVTRRAHRVPVSPWWDQRVGHSRFRRSDLPAGGSAALIVAAVLAGAGQRSAAVAVAAVGVGAAVGAVVTGVSEPLPPPAS